MCAGAGVLRSTRVGGGDLSSCDGGMWRILAGWLPGVVVLVAGLWNRAVSGL